MARWRHVSIANDNSSLGILATAALAVAFTLAVAVVRKEVEERRKRSKYEMAMLTTPRSILNASTTLKHHRARAWRSCASLDDTDDNDIDDDEHVLWTA